MPDLTALLVMLEPLVKFYGSNALLVLLVGLIAELVSGVARSHVDTYPLPMLHFKLVCKAAMYVSLFTMFKLWAPPGVALEYAVDAFVLVEFVAVLKNWKVVTDKTDDPAEVVIDALLRMISLDRFKSPKA